MNDIYTNTDSALDVLCLKIIEGAKQYYEENPPKHGGATIREHVEFWVENYLRPAIEDAIDTTFEDEDEDEEEAENDD